MNRPDAANQLAITVSYYRDLPAAMRIYYAGACGRDNLSDLFINDEIGIRAFVFNDPEGYQIEIQSATQAGA